MSRARQLTVALVAAALPALAACPGPTPTFADARGDYQRLADGGATCLPNNDGVIELGELSFRAGLEATYRVNPPGTLVDVDVGGKIVGGTTEWDFSATDGNVVPVPVEAAAGFWFAKHFAGASFVLGADIKGQTLQVFQLTGDRLLLLGLASRKADETLMIYDKPVESLRFPLRLGDSFTFKSTVTNGKLNNLPIATEDTYEVQVDARGTVRLPYVKLLSSLRVRVAVTSRAVGGVQVTRRQAQWFHECYGEVVRAVSQNNEPSADFGKAIEVRRLSF